MIIILTALGGLLARLDGWGGNKWFSVWSCGVLFGGLMLAYHDIWICLIAAGAFIIWRLPGFDGWGKWLNMFWRGLWTSAIGFGALAAYTGHYWGILLALAMGVAEMVAYSLPRHLKLADEVAQTIAEVVSGMAFTALFIMEIQ